MITCVSIKFKSHGTWWKTYELHASHNLEVFHLIASHPTAATKEARFDYNYPTASNKFWSIAREVADSCMWGIFIRDRAYFIVIHHSMKHKVILHWMTMKYAVSLMKKPQVQESTTSLTSHHCHQMMQIWFIIHIPLLPAKESSFGSHPTAATKG